MAIKICDAEGGAATAESGEGSVRRATAPVETQAPQARVDLLTFIINVLK